MKAAICRRYGPPEVLRTAELTKPVPGHGGLLVKVAAAGVILGDCELRAFRFPAYGPFLRFMVRLGFGFTGLRKKILGQQCAGQVEETGEGVSSFSPGDRVYMATGFSLGAYAEYLSIKESAAVAAAPRNMSYREASTLPVGGSEALHFIEAADIRPGQQVLINGAGGSIGMIAVQLAVLRGARVTAVDGGEKRSMLMSLGAERCFDYRTESFLTAGRSYHVLFDVIGTTRLAECIPLLKPGACYLFGNGSLSSRDKRRARRAGVRVFDRPASYTAEKLRRLAELIDGGKLRTVIDRVFPLEQAADAHRFVEQEQRCGNVVLTMAPDQGRRDAAVR